MALSNYQVSFDAVTFGPSTSYELVAIDGLGLPDLRTSDVPRANAHGYFPGEDLLEGRTVTLTLDVRAASASAFASAIAALEAATLPLEGEYPLSYKRGTDVAKRVYCRPRRRSIPVDLAYEAGATQAVLEFFASDPRIYADTESTASTSLPQSSGGRTYPKTYPKAYGTVTAGGTVTATNSGNTDAPLTVTFVGPVDNPAITNATTDELVAFDFSLGIGDQLVVDLDEGTAILNGTASRLNKLRAGSEFFALVPGVNELRYSASTYNATTYVYLAWRSAWL